MIEPRTPALTDEVLLVVIEVQLSLLMARNS